MKHIKRISAGGGAWPRVTHLLPGSLAYKAGIRTGDRIMTVNGEPIRDGLDFLFYTGTQHLVVILSRRAGVRTVRLTRTPGKPLGIQFAPGKVRRCNNRCLFCFVLQLPRGLRRSVYVKDEDYRHSFLNGNYLTLTSETRRDFNDIITKGLTPLYISVHATDTKVRRLLLGNPRAPDIMRQLRFLQENGIQCHTQIVVCPGINDGSILRTTIRDLLGLPGVLSVAVVPVGLTAHRKTPLRMVDRAVARTVCSMIDPMSDRDRAIHGRRRLFIADEFFLRADRAVQARRYYEDFPQIKNGVGLVRQLLDEWRDLRRKRTGPRVRPPGVRKRPVIVTGVSAAPFLERIAGQTAATPAADVVPVVNRFFGESVTVAGLLTGRDIVRTLQAGIRNRSCVIVPKVIFNMHGHTLDGWSLNRMEKVLGKPVYAAGSVAELSRIIAGNGGRRRS